MDRQGMEPGGRDQEGQAMSSTLQPPVDLHVGHIGSTVGSEEALAVHLGCGHVRRDQAGEVWEPQLLTDSRRGRSGVELKGNTGE